LIANNYKTAKKKQGGIALLVLVVVLALALSTYYFTTISVVDIKIGNKEKTRDALKQAKQALINYAVTHADGNGNGEPGEYGYLPCPDTTAFSTEGNQDGTCGGRYKNFLGYLPWKTLDLSLLKDGSGNCLWYAVSGNYKGEISSGLINEDTDGLFQVVNSSGDILQDEAIAIVFSPGVPLDLQARVYDANTHCGEDYGNESAYLEGDGIYDNSSLPDVADSVDQFIHETLISASEGTPPYNDNFITISRQEIWSIIMKRSDLQVAFEETTEALTQCLAEYINHAENSDKRIPWPAPMDIDGNDLRVMDNYSDKLNAAVGYAGRFPFHIDDSNTVIITTVIDSLIDDVICSSLNLPVSGLTGIDLTDTSAKHRRILENWKDHFFYASSFAYSVTGTGLSSCGNCISIAGTEYAAIIFFGHSPISPQVRTDTGKLLILNYLENNNDIDFPDTTGDSVYEAASAMPNSNDIMYCITTDVVPVVEVC
jgi:hypothetical protein